MVGVFKARGHWYCTGIVPTTLLYCSLSHVSGFQLQAGLLQMRISLSTNEHVSWERSSVIYSTLVAVRTG